MLKLKMIAKENMVARPKRRHDGARNCKKGHVLPQFLTFITTFRFEMTFKACSSHLNAY